MYEELNALRRHSLEESQRLSEIFEKMTVNPMEVQTRLLMELLEANKDTEYGRRYGFTDITSIEEYQARVPITTYDDYADYIDRMSCGGERNLICADDPIWYNKTSGTVSSFKKIPYTMRSSDIFNRYNLGWQRAIIYSAVGDDFFGGRGLNLIRCGGSIERQPDGVPYAPISEAALHRFKDKWSMYFPTPMQAVFAGAGTDTRYLNARYSLIDYDLNNIVCTFTGVLLDFCRYIEGNWEMLVHDIECGTISEEVELPAATREELTCSLEPMPERAAELRAVFERGFDEPFMPLVWPRLSYVVAGASAGFARYTNEVRDRYLGRDVAFYYRGVSASEGAFTVPTELAQDATTLIPDALFFEFLPEEDEGARPLTMAELEEGRKYELVISNFSGFWRYRMRDVVKVVGWHNATPMVEFQYRIDKTVSLMSEKTTELAQRTAVEGCARECGFALVDSSLYPDTEKIRYTFVLEIDRVPAGLTEDEVRDCLQRSLCEANPAYAGYIRSGLIKPLEIVYAQPETYVLYKDAMLMRGSPVAQLKPVTVISNEAQRRFFFKLVDDFEEVKAVRGL